MTLEKAPCVNDGSGGGGEGHRYQSVTLLSWKQVLTSPGMLGPATLQGISPCPSSLPNWHPVPASSETLLLLPHGLQDRGTNAHSQAGAGSATSSCHHTLSSKVQYLPALPKWGGNARQCSFSGSLLALGQGEGLDGHGFAWQPGRRASFQMGWGRDCPLGLEPLTFHRVSVKPQAAPGGLVLT